MNKKILMLFGISNIMVFLIANILVSCNKDTGKAQEVAEQFVSAFNKKDKAAIYDLFPSVREFKFLTIKDTVAVKDGINVNYNDADSTFEASLGSDGIQKVILKKLDDGTFAVEDLYNFFTLDSAVLELGLKTGVPLKKISDKEKSYLFDPDEDYIDFLSEQNPSAANANLVRENGNYTWSRNFYYSTVNVTTQIRNDGDQKVDGEDYNIEIDFYNLITGKYLKSVTEPGRTLDPGERADIYSYMPELYKTASDRALRWNCNFKMKKLTRTECLEKYGKFKGDEYAAFVQQSDSFVKQGIKDIPQGKLSLKGKIDKYPIQMDLDINERSVTGTYYYQSQGPDKKLKITGKIGRNNKMRLKEYDVAGKETGRFVGTLIKKNYSGVFETQGKYMNFDLDEAGKDDKKDNEKEK